MSDSDRIKAIRSRLDGHVGFYNLDVPYLLERLAESERRREQAETKLAEQIETNDRLRIRFQKRGR